MKDALLDLIAAHAICARDRNTEDGEVFYAFDDLLEGLQS